MSDTDNHAHVDWARTIKLPNSGWKAAVAIGPDGEETLWLVSPTPDQPAGCACQQCAPYDYDTDTIPGARQREQAT